MPSILSSDVEVVQPAEMETFMKNFNFPVKFEWFIKKLKLNDICFVIYEIIEI